MESDFFLLQVQVGQLGGKNNKSLRVQENRRSGEEVRKVPFFVIFASNSKTICRTGKRRIKQFDLQVLFFQQDSSSPNTANATIKLLGAKIGDSVICRNGTVRSPPLLGDLNTIFIGYPIYGYGGLLYKFAGWGPCFSAATDILNRFSIPANQKRFEN